jgi:hypothetical protein
MPRVSAFVYQAWVDAGGVSPPAGADEMALRRREAGGEAAVGQANQQWTGSSGHTPWPAPIWRAEDGRIG